MKDKYGVVSLVSETSTITTIIDAVGFALHSYQPMTELEGRQQHVMEAYVWLVYHT